MVTRLRKRIGCCLLGPALVLGGGWVAWHHVLPSVMTRRLITAMEDGGLPGSDLRIHPPGLWQSRASELRTGTGSWRLQLDTATAHYQPLELLHARIDALTSQVSDWIGRRAGVERRTSQVMLLPLRPTPCSHRGRTRRPCVA